LPEVSDAARITYFALHALQHRGQESCGIVSSTGYSHYSHKAMGLVMQVSTQLIYMIYTEGGVYFNLFFRK
jgi:glutamine phosphoribosylpyrophosphate amidotransferase